MTVAMALAERTHHSSRGQTIARAGGVGAQDELHGHDPGPPSRSSSALKKSPAGCVPDRLFAVSGPQARVQRRTVQKIVDFAPLPTLDDPAPQIWYSCLTCSAFFGRSHLIPEQVIEVPTFLSEDVSLRTAVREPQLVEQLVEVPTVVSWSLLQRIMEQNVGIPVVDRGGRSSGLQGFLPGQSSTIAAWSSRTHFRAKCGADRCSRVLGGGHQDFLPGQSSSSSSHDPARVYEALDGPGEGFFRTCPHFFSKKKCGCGPTLGVGTGRGLEPIHAASLLRAHWRSRKTSPSQ